MNLFYVNFRNDILDHCVTAVVYRGFSMKRINIHFYMLCKAC